MIEPTCSRRDAASVIFNLPDYHVIDAVDLPSGGRRVIVQADTVADGCPDCGVVWFPPNRGGFGYAASPAGTAVLVS